MISTVVIIIAYILCRISGIFVPIVVIIAIITFLIWFFLGLGGALPEKWTQQDGVFLFAFLKAIAVLVIAWYILI